MAVSSREARANEHCSRPNLLAVSQPSPALACTYCEPTPKLRRLINNQKSQTRHGTIPFQGLTKTLEGFFARPSLYGQLDLQLDNSVGSGYGLLISIENTMTFTMTFFFSTER